jgi:hypothetical protein
MQGAGNYLKDMMLFFWPALIVCGAIGFIASAKERKVLGSIIGLAGGGVLAIVLILMGPPPGRP